MEYLIRGKDVNGKDTHIVLNYMQIQQLHDDIGRWLEGKNFVLVERGQKDGSIPAAVTDKVEPGPVTPADLEKITSDQKRLDEIKRKLQEEWERQQKDKPSETWFPSTWPVRPSPSVPGPTWTVYPSPTWAPTSPWTTMFPDCPGMTVASTDTPFFNTKAPDA